MRIPIRRQYHPALTAFVASIAIVIATSSIAPLPVPQFHDEFSYMLAGDTFVRGRLTNPAHPLWEFFETFQVLSQPTYASKYPPGQGMFLAAGQLLARDPIFGVWLSTALACAAIAWMSRAVLPSRWAMLCGLLAATHPQVLDWNWSYWGGSVAMLGGALLIGATLRMRMRASWIDGIVAGVGIAILANARPLEGAVVTVLCIGWILLPLAASRIGTGAISDLRRRQRRLLGAFVLVLAMNFAWMGYYNYRVTGCAATLPYSLYERQYAPTRPLAWLPPPTSQPAYRHAAMREFYLDWELPNYLRQRSVGGFVQASLGKLRDFAKGFGRAPTLLVALIGLPLALRRWRWARAALLIVVICVLNSLPVLTHFPHYSAPVASLLFVLLAACCLAIRQARVAIISILLIGQAIALVHWMYQQTQTDPQSWNRARQAFIDEQAAAGKQVLVFVHFEPGSYVHNEYVFNSADIDAQPVVWARDMGHARNRELIDYYNQRGQTRELWRLDVGRSFGPYNARE